MSLRNKPIEHEAARYAEWLRLVASAGGKGVVDNIDARALGRVAEILDILASRQTT